MSNGDYLYVQIYKRLKDEIEQAFYKQGDRLPTEKELSDKYNVSRITSQKAMNMLVEEGSVIRYPGIGSFVAGGTVEHTILCEPKRKKEDRKIIGLVLEAIWNCFGIGLFDGAYEKARTLGYDLVIKKSYGDQALEMEAINELIDMGAEGIIIMPVHGDYYSEELLKLVLDKFPIVFIDRYLNGIHVPFVGSDNVGASSDCVSFLVEKGHEHIALITTKDHEATTLDERKQGYLDGCIKNNLIINKSYIYDNIKCIVPHTYCPNETNDTLAKVEDFLMKNNEVTAVVTTEYFIGNLVKKAAQNIGKRIPEDLQIICFDAPLEYLGEYEFTHIRQDEEQMGEKATDLLDQLIKGEQKDSKILLGAKLVEGRSTSNLELP